MLVLHCTSDSPGFVVVAGVQGEHGAVDAGSLHPGDVSHGLPSHPAQRVSGGRQCSATRLAHEGHGHLGKHGGKGQ